MSEVSGKLLLQDPPEAPGFIEWFRMKVGAKKLISISYEGPDGIGPREIEKLIIVLQAQKEALEE